MIEFLKKSSLIDFTRDEFENLLIRISDPKAGTEAEDSKLVAHFNAIVPHPAKSDLLFWPEAGADSSNNGIIAAIERYCRENGLPCFKDSEF